MFAALDLSEFEEAILYFKSDREQWPLLAKKLDEMAINKYCTTTALMKAVNEVRRKLGLPELDRYSSYTKTMDETDRALRKITLNETATHSESSLPIEEHPNFEAFIRAFWRRIEPYKNDYGKELPEEIPGEFVWAMSSAGLLLRETKPVYCSHCNKKKPATHNTEVGMLCDNCYQDAIDGGL